jgi:transcriptional regulator with XRE-family HTH domain
MSPMYQISDGVSGEIIAKLIELQGDLTDEMLAARIGCTRTHLSHLRSGRRQMSYALVKRAARAFPALYPIVMRDLMADPAEATRAEQADQGQERVA